MLDQSKNMLTKRIEKATSLNIEHKISFLNSNFFLANFDNIKFDSALSSFFLSHLNNKQLDLFFSKIKNAINKKGLIVILDSSSKDYNIVKDVSIQTRTIKNGQEFQIYKRYFHFQEIIDLLWHFDLEILSFYYGSSFFAVSCSNN